MRNRTGAVGTPTEPWTATRTVPAAPAGRRVGDRDPIPLPGV